MIGPLAAALADFQGTEDTREAMRVQAVRMLRAGVRPTVSEWVSMSEPERRALEDASAEIRETGSTPSRDADLAMARALDSAGGA